MSDFANSAVSEQLTLFYHSHSYTPENTKGWSLMVSWNSLNSV